MIQPRQDRPTAGPNTPRGAIGENLAGHGEGPIDVEEGEDFAGLLLFTRRHDDLRVPCVVHDDFLPECPTTARTPADE